MSEKAYRSREGLVSRCVPGYIVRGKDGVDVWWQYLADGDWDTTTTRSEATTLALSPALRAAEEMRQAASHVCVLAVSDDGTETPLPTYEEALASLAELRAKVATLRETADACEDARSLHDAIVDFCGEVSK